VKNQIPTGCRSYHTDQFKECALGVTNSGLKRIGSVYRDTGNIKNKIGEDQRIIGGDKDSLRIPVLKAVAFFFQ
jgi:hypothetical protein